MTLVYFEDLIEQLGVVITLSNYPIKLLMLHLSLHILLSQLSKMLFKFVLLFIEACVEFTLLQLMVDRSQ